MDKMGERTCIVTRQRLDAPDALVRFVAAPDGSVAPDLRLKLPGRGCWVTANRQTLEKAVKGNAFARALKVPVKPDPDLADLVDRLMQRAALGALGLARKAGAIALGAAKVEAQVRSGKALAVVHAFEASPDGIRKIDQARKATFHLGGPVIAAYKLFPEAELGLALGGTNVIHAAVLDQEPGNAALRRLMALDRYRGGVPEEWIEAAAGLAGGEAEEDYE